MACVVLPVSPVSFLPRNVGTGIVYRTRGQGNGECAMNDVLYVGLALGFFALSWAFIAAV